MSSDDESLEQAILDSFSRLLVENYCIIASSVLLFADSFITFPEEVERIWKRRFTGATVVFLITRCVPVLRLDDTLTDISYLMFGIFMMLRARGIWGRGWFPIALLAFLTPVRTIVTIYVQVHYTPIAFGSPLYGCGALYNLSEGAIRGRIGLHVVLRLSITSKASSISIDIVVLVLTWVRTLGLKRESRRLGLHTPIVTLLLRDGTMYFLVILFIQVFSIVSSVVGSDFVLWDVWPYFDQVFTVIFSCRFMLNLRGVYLSSSISGESEDTTTYHFGTGSAARGISTLHFTSSIVGNLGAPIQTFGSSAGTRSTAVDDGDAAEDMEGEKLEVSSDPLFVGLRRPECMELPETRTTP
ncbi:hypothetical protein ONZ51_g10056 [Trametes cubensis]|uniref:DUF6533 domain-containing protein n=1 Tax=Trametes cubensis TaxID=1111947 RepID=A0AAD7TMR6_9APHY|nr:hypothetical protein ONZ51_g10056 [Trametes cubensis]